MASFPEILENLIAEDKLDQAIKNLYDAIVYYRNNCEDACDISILKKHTILISSRYKDLQKQIIANIIDSQAATLTKNQIVQSFLEIIDQIEDYEHFVIFVDDNSLLNETAWFVEDENEYNSLEEEEYIAQPQSIILNWWDNLSLEWKRMFRQSTNIPENPTEADLTNLETIEKLDISVNHKIHSLQPIKMLPNLRELYCDDTKIIDIEPVEHVPNLEILSIRYTSVKSLQPIKNLTNLRILDCSNTLIQSLEPISNNHNLDTLICTLTLIESIKPIFKIKSLRRLNCENFQLKEDEVVQFKSMHPKCRVNEWN